MAEDDIDAKAVNLTTFIFKIPPYRTILLYLLLSSIIAGILTYHVYANYYGVAASPTPFADVLGRSEPIFIGGAEGLFLFAFPAVLSAVLAASILSRKTFRQAIKYFLFIAFLSQILTAFFYVAGLAVVSAKFISVPLVDLASIVLFANSLVFILWFVSLLVPLNFKFSRAILVAFINPVVNISFFVLLRAYAVFETQSAVLIALKFLGAVVVLLSALWVLFAITNAPARRNFGISTIQAATFFFAQWISGGKGLEEVLSEVGTEVETFVSTIVFKAGAKPRAVFVVPCIHYGPFGNLGGSEFPHLFSREIHAKYGCPGFVFHATANHDFNPVFSSSHHHLQAEVNKQIDAALGGSKPAASTAAFISAKNGMSHVFGVSFGNGERDAFVSLSRAPSSTEDIDLALGLAFKEKVRRHGFDDVVIVDRHNAKTSGRLIETGSKGFFEYDEALESLRLSRSGRLRLGIAENRLAGISAEQGIAKGGLKVAVFEIGGRRACIVLFDANNCLPSFRAHVLEGLRSYGFDFVDVFTSDSHAVNSVNGVHNPLGERISAKQLLPEIRKTVDEALENIEPAQTVLQTSRVRLRVLGEKRSSELLSTVNAIVAVLKIVAPFILVASFLLAFGLLIFLGRALV